MPLFYAVHRQLLREHSSAVVSALHITPIRVVIIRDVLDAELVRDRQYPVAQVANEAEAMTLAEELGRAQCRALVIGEAEGLVAHYEDGHKEGVVVSC